MHGAHFGQYSELKFEIPFNSHHPYVDSTKNKEKIISALDLTQNYITFEYEAIRFSFHDDGFSLVSDLAAYN